MNNEGNKGNGKGREKQLERGVVSILLEGASPMENCPLTFLGILNFVCRKITAADSKNLKSVKMNFHNIHDFVRRKIAAAGSEMSSETDVRVFCAYLVSGLWLMHYYGEPYVDFTRQIRQQVSARWLPAVQETFASMVAEAEIGQTEASVLRSFAELEAQQQRGMPEMLMGGVELAPVTS